MNAQGSYVYTYTYDGADRRITTSQNSFDTSYWYQGLNTISARNANGTTDYLFLPGIDEPVATSSGGAVTYYAVDGLGSIVARTDGSGQALEGIQYSPWGEPSTAISGLFNYTARESFEGGLYYRARIYQPSTGRFISEDPLGGLGGPNLYAYAENSPADLSDPFGLAKKGHKKQPPPPPSPPPTPDCGTICNMAYADPKLNGNGGGIVCYEGKKCPCAFDTDFALRGQCPAFDANIIEHEQKHIPESSCPPHGLCRGKFPAPYNGNYYECKHRKESIDGLLDAIQSGRNSPMCVRAMEAQILSFRDWIEKNCGR